MNSNTEMNYIEEDEIDLRELWQMIVKGKKIIVMITTFVTIITFIYVLKLPNVYKSEAILIPTENSGGGGLAGLGGLAAMAGISVGGGGTMTPDVAFNSLLNDYEFMKIFVIKNKFDEYYQDENRDKNFVFAFGFRGIYNLLKSSPSKLNKEAEIFNIVKKMRSNMSIKSDKKTSLISVSYSASDRKISPVVLNAFLHDASKYLVKNNLRIIENKLTYFSKEMREVEGFKLRESLSAMISKILQEKVMMKSKPYYQCDILIEPSVAYIKDKTKPKRGLILVVAFITSIILGVFLVFFIEFIKGTKEEDKVT